MNITILIDALRDDLAAVAEIGDERSATVAARPGPPPPPPPPPG
jgi:hypothetical protein